MAFRPRGRRVGFPVHELPKFPGDKTEAHGNPGADLANQHRFEEACAIFAKAFTPDSDHEYACGRSFTVSLSSIFPFEVSP